MIDSFTSSKVRDDIIQVGQYGTGFLTTHKFGLKFELSGALYIKELAHTKYKHQEEILFKRGMRCIITSVIKEGNSYVLTGEVI